MIEAAMIWNEPNNKSHWDPELDPDWTRFARHGDLRRRGDPRPRRRACRACSAASRRSIPASSRNMAGQGRARRTSTSSPCTASRSTGTCGRSTNGRQSSTRSAPSPTCRSGCRRSASRPSAPRRCRSSGFERTAELLIGRAPRIHWYSLYDLPRPGRRRRATARPRARPITGISTWACCARTARRSRAAEPFARLHAGAGHLPVVPLRGSPARRRGALAEAARRAPPAHRPVLGRQLPPERARLVRPPDARARPIRRDGDLLLHARSTAGIAPHHTSPPLVAEEFAEFCAAMMRRYAPGAGASEAGAAAGGGVDERHAGGRK